MSREAALAEARVLKDSLESHGVRVSIELQAGARLAYGWMVPPGMFRLEMSHHIVSRRSQGLTPFLSLVKTGRPDVVGPLCNGYGGFDEVYRIITMGVANHAGKGGPLTIDGVTVARDRGSYFAWGTEYEGGLDPKDWTPSFRGFMAASNAGIIDYLRLRNGKTTDAGHCEHSTWAPGRKSDRMLYSRADGIAEIKSHRNGRSYSTTYVREVQRLLNVVAGAGLVEDGVFGPITVAAIIAFQANAGLVTDGDPGPVTMEALRRAAELLEDEVLEYIKASDSTRIYAFDGISKRLISNPDLLAQERKVTGKQATHILTPAAVAAIPDVGTVQGALTVQDVKTAVAEGLAAAPGGVDPDQVAQRVVDQIVGRLSQ